MRGLRRSDIEVKERLHQLELHLNMAARAQGYSSFLQKVAYEAVDDMTLMKEILGYYFPKLKSIEAKIDQDGISRLIINMPGSEVLELGQMEQEQLPDVTSEILDITPVIAEKLLSERETEEA